MASSSDVIVVGAGVLGLCTAAELCARGHAVTVIDPGGPNASSIAAGMIAPALESLLENASAERAALMRRARDLWPDFAAAHGLVLSREGADWRGPDAGAVAARLEALGFDARPDGEGLTTPDDWRIEVCPALATLARSPGLDQVRGRVVRLTGEARDWHVETADGRARFTPAVVLATGAADPLPGLPEPVAAMVAAITPIRGQLTVATGVTPPRVIRGPGVYAAPCGDSVAFGATMEPGRRDLEPDIAVAKRQVEAGLALLGVNGVPGAARVGVRGATSDGLPLAGPSGEPGLHLSLAPRRNGWLMGPLVARIVADGIEGVTPLADAAALDPLRFA